MFSQPQINALSLVAMLVKRELKVKYRGSVFGYLWSMLNPLFFMIIISFVFSHLMRGIEHYELYVLSGILFWNMTAQGISGGANAFVNNAGLLVKVKAPIWIFAIVPLGSAIVNFSLALVPYFTILIYKGLYPPSSILFIPFVLIIYALFLSGISLILATLNVFFRDVAHVLDPVLQVLFYATPVIYHRNQLPDSATINQILNLNPFAHFIDIFRWSVFKSEIEISYLGLLAIILISVSSFFLGLWIYKVNKNKFIFKL